MKAFGLFALISLSAQAFPELYCVSTAGYGAITNISIFTNAKGTLRASAEITSQEGYLADIDSIVTLQRLNYDDSTKVIANDKGTFKFILDDKELTPSQATKYGVTYYGEEGEVRRFIGHKVEFKKYRLGSLKNFKIPAKKDSWQEALNDAFKAGVNQYLCGNAKDIKKDQRSIHELNT